MVEIVISVVVPLVIIIVLVLCTGVYSQVVCSYHSHPCHRRSWQVDEAAVQAIEVEDSGVAGGVAKGDEARTLLLNPKTRSQFMDELHEVCIGVVNVYV